MTTNDLIKCIEKAVAKMQEALDDPQRFGIVIQNVNYEFNCGMYYAYMNVLMEQDSEKHKEVYEKYFSTVEKLASVADVRYRNLKKICGIA